MKTLKTVPFLLLLTLAGCKQSSDMLLAAHATPATEAARAESSYAYSGANIPASAPRGQVYEFH
jgi:hypothetical protein